MKKLGFLVLGLLCGVSLGVVNAGNYVTTVPGLVVTGEQDGQVFEYGVLKFDDGNGHVIMLLDRNLGATMTGAGAEANTGSYGYHYQWGNNYGFEIGCWTNSCSDLVSENATMTRAIWNDNYNNSGYYGHEYITVNGYDDYFDYWSDNLHHDGLRGGSGDNDGNNRGLDTMTTQNIINRQGPCPVGYHVPSAGEFNNLFTYRHNVKYSGNFLTGDLKNIDIGDYNWDYEMEEYIDKLSKDFAWMFNIPFAGFRDYADPRFFSVGQDASLYTSTACTFRLAPGMWVGTFDKHYYNEGYSIRCFSNDYLFPFHFFLISNGIEVKSGSVISGEKLANIIDFNNIKIDGYIIDYWHLDGEDLPFDFTDSAITGNITLNAKLTPIEYEIKYELDGGKITKIT